MNVLFVSYQPFPYGMAGSKRIRLFAECLAKNNTVKVLVIGNNNDRNPNIGVEKNISYRFIKINRIQSFTNFVKVKKILKANYKHGSKNIIYLYDGISLTNYLFAIIGKKIGYKIITDVVEDYSVHKENAGFLLSIRYKTNIFFEKRLDRLADGVIVISNKLKDKIEKLSVKKEKLELIPISAENINFDDGNYIINPACFTFVYAGSFGNKDGVEVLISAFKKLFKKRQDIKLLLAGDINAKILQLIENVSGITYAGMIPDQEYYQFLNAADVLLMTRVNSEYAHTGFPFKLGEYLATGRPVIATRVSDIELYLKDNEDIILAAPSDSDSLLSAFEFAVNNRTEILKIGKNGKEKCRLYFNPLTNGEKLESFINRLYN